MKIKIPFLNYTVGLAKQPRPGPWDDFWFQLAAQASKSGISVNENTALNLSTVWAAVRIISESIASLPLITYEQKGKKKERAVDHPLYDLLHIQPNPEETAMQYREATQAHLLLWGNSYSQIERSYAGDVIALWPLRPDRMQVIRPEKEVIYVYHTTNGEKIEFPPKEILHIAGLGFNGLIGYSVIERHREAIGLALAGETFQSSTFKNMASPSGFLTTDSTSLNQETAKALAAAWFSAQGGLDKAGSVAVMSHGMKFEKVGMPLKDVEFLGLRKFQVLEICRIFNIPPYKLMDFDRATFSNVEQTAIDFVVHTLRPWLIRTEQAIMVKLLSREERRSISVEHLVEGLLRGDTKSRYEAYGAGIQMGWLNRNEAREKENLNPVPGLDEYLVPLNMSAVGEEPPPRGGDNGKGEEKDYQKKLYELMGRQTREIADIRKQLNIGERRTRDAVA